MGTKKIYTGNKRINVWWADDCFLSSECIPSTDMATDVIADIYLPLDRLGEFSSDSEKKGIIDNVLERNRSSYMANGEVYLFLKETAKLFDINFNVCTFEYLQQNWQQIDDYGSIVFLDIGYSAKKDQTFGANLYVELTKQSGSTKAEVIFLTSDQNRIKEFVRKSRRVIQPRCIAKEDCVFDNYKDLEIFIVIESFISKQPCDLGDIDANGWLCLRNLICQKVDDFSKIYKCGSTWPGHLPTGGKHITSYAIEGVTFLRSSCNHPTSNMPLNLPDFSWTSDVRWEVPPVRALAMSEHLGRDLTRFLHHLCEDIKQSFSGRLNLIFTYPSDNFTHDYLWFNVVALGRAIKLLCSCFADELQKVHPVKIGTVMVDVREWCNSDVNGIEIVIRQLVEFYIDEEERHSSNWGGVISRGNPGGHPTGVFVPEKNSKKKIKTVHEYFKRSGGVVNPTGRDKNDWRVFIAAENKLGCWQVIPPSERNV